MCCCQGRLTVPALNIVMSVHEGNLPSRKMTKWPCFLFDWENPATLCTVVEFSGINRFEVIAYVLQLSPLFLLFSFFLFFVRI